MNCKSGVHFVCALKQLNTEAKEKDKKGVIIRCSIFVFKIALLHLGYERMDVGLKV